MTNFNNKPDIKLEKKLNRWAWVITAVVLLLVSTMHTLPKIFAGTDFSFLPGIYSSLNALTAVLLIAALYFIKNGKAELHRKTMNAAVICSGLFLLGYVIYHLTYEDVKFGDANFNGILDDEEKMVVAGIRPFYLGMLISHIILAGAILPFILFTYIRALTNQFDRHKKMARWVYWLWLYVAITGPILYIMVKPYYPWLQ